MRLATIDLGTNTVRLLVADARPGAARWHVVDHAQQVTRLGEGVRASGRLAEAPAARTSAVVRDYVGRARARGATRIEIVATSAVREAANGAQFAAELERVTGARVRVVSGQEEARLTLLGIVSALGPGTGTTLAFDIGGGSTEFILARQGRLTAAVSLRLGVVPLAERYPFPGPADAARYRALEDELAQQLARELPSALATAQVDRLVGSAGTVTALAALDLGLVTYDAERVQGHLLTRPAVDRQRARLAALDVAGRAALPCLEPGRADLILPGIAIVTATMDRFRCDQLTVSDWGLREGILADVLTGAI
ncbi:MAG TPA: Ppx/GppA phosphatase family protein [Methylomirabilota bacterium]|nr:Ppx/GppA phosphatase family protein [Methylomirabilota bacterium]